MALRDIDGFTSNRTDGVDKKDLSIAMNQLANLFDWIP